MYLVGCEFGFHRPYVITAMGHFVSWIVEMLVFGTLSLLVLSRHLIDLHQGKLDLSLWMFTMLIPSMNYAIFPAIQVPPTLGDVSLAFLPRKPRGGGLIADRAWVL